MEDRPEATQTLSRRTVNWEKVQVVAEINMGYGAQIVRVKTGQGHTDCCFLDGRLVRTEVRTVEERI